MCFAQSQVNADRMHLRTIARQAQHAMQQAAVLVAADGHVEVVMLDDLEFRQQRIAVIACRVHRIAPVGKLRPERVGEELVLRHRRPVAVALGVMFVGAVDLLQEHHVGRHAAHGLTQLRQNETPIERREALVRVHGQHRETMHRRRGWGSLYGGLNGKDSLMKAPHRPPVRPAWSQGSCPGRTA